MLELIEKELSINNVSMLPGGVIEIAGVGGLPITEASDYFKEKAKNAYKIVEKLWKELAELLASEKSAYSKPPEGIENIFIYAVQGLKISIDLFPGLDGFEKIKEILSSSLSKDVNSFSYRTMSKAIEYKLAIEWVSHILNKNLYIRSLVNTAYKIRRKDRQSVAKGVFGPFSNLDLPMQERVFPWSDIDEEVRGRDADMRNQARYKKGLEGYNDPHVNEGFVWREIKNEPFLWGKEGENPYPHRNALWS